MVRVHIICEGQTEETFINNLLAPYFNAAHIYLYPSLLNHRGGTVTFERLFLDVRNRLLDDQNAYCTTFFDFYGLPPDFPGKESAQKVPLISDKAAAICNHMAALVQERLGENAIRRFIPYVQMHEFEALLFSDSQKFAQGINQPNLASAFQEIRDDFSSPEDINDNPDTAPSRRISVLVQRYEKPLYGTLAALEIGLERMRAQCGLFHAWLEKLESLTV